MSGELQTPEPEELNETTPPAPKNEEVSPSPESETGLKNFESRRDELNRMAYGLRKDRETTFQLSSLQSEGLQTLITDYGMDKVFGAIKKQLEPDKNHRDLFFSTYDIIRILEPSNAKRNKLYEQILVDAEVQAEKIEQDLKNPNNTEPHEYFNLKYGNGANFVLGLQHNVQAIKNLDSILGKIAPQDYRNFLSGEMGSFANKISEYGKVPKFEEQTTRIKEELAQSGNNVFRLVEQRTITTDKQNEQLRLQVDQLCNELKIEIQRISNELNNQLEEYRAQVISDLGKIGSLAAESKTVQIELENALKKVQEEISRTEETTKKEIETKTAPFSAIIARVAGLDRI